MPGPTQRQGHGACRGGGDTEGVGGAQTVPGGLVPLSPYVSRHTHSTWHRHTAGLRVDDAGWERRLLYALCGRHLLWVAIWLGLGLEVRIIIWISLCLSSIQNSLIFYSFVSLIPQIKLISFSFEKCINSVLDRFLFVLENVDFSIHIQDKSEKNSIGAGNKIQETVLYVTAINFKDDKLF